MTSSQKIRLVALAVLIAALVPIVYLNITLRRDCASLKKQLESANAAASSVAVSNKPKANRPAPAIASSAGAPDNPEEIKERLEDIRGQNEQIRQDLDEQRKDFTSFDANRQEITLEDLEKKDPEAYKSFMHHLNFTWRLVQQTHSEQLQLLDDLDASKGLIPDDELEVLRSYLVRSIKKVEYELSLAPEPLEAIPDSGRVTTPPSDPRLLPQHAIRHFCLAESRMEEDGLAPDTLDNLSITLQTPQFFLPEPYFLPK